MPRPNAARGLPAIGAYEVVDVGSVGLAQKFHEPDHGIVIERDVAVIRLRRRSKLRPAAARVFRLEDVVKSLENRLGIDPPGLP